MLLQHDAEGPLAVAPYTLMMLFVPLDGRLLKMLLMLT